MLLAVILSLQDNLFEAASEGDLEKVKLLIQNGADVNAKGWNGQTPLHYASRKGYLDIVKFLVQNGADVNAKNKDGKTPCDLAKDEEIKSIMNYCK